jgi:hypothetical protein
MSFNIAIDILTHEPYRAVCDDCDWTSMNTRHLSNALYWWNNHKLNHEWEHSYLEPIPAPMKPSQVLANV